MGTAVRDPAAGSKESRGDATGINAILSLLGQSCPQRATELVEQPWRTGKWYLCDFIPTAASGCLLWCISPSLDLFSHPFCFTFLYLFSLSPLLSISGFIYLAHPLFFQFFISPFLCYPLSLWFLL